MSQPIAVFEAHFADDTKTRIAWDTSVTRLDLGRAMILSAAWLTKPATEACGRDRRRALRNAQRRNSRVHPRRVAGSHHEHDEYGTNRLGGLKIKARLGQAGASSTN